MRIVVEFRVETYQQERYSCREATPLLAVHDNDRIVATEERCIYYDWSFQYVQVSTYSQSLPAPAINTLQPQLKLRNQSFQPKNLKGHPQLLTNHNYQY